MEFKIRVGSEVGTLFTIKAKSLNELKSAYDEMVEGFAPLNSSPEGAEAYRQRFRGKEIFVQRGKDFVKLD